MVNLHHDLKHKYVQWIKAQLESKFSVLQGLINLMKKEITEYVSKNLDYDQFKGFVGLTAIEFFDEKLELTFTTHFEDLGNEPKKFRTVNVNGPRYRQTNALEIMIDENVANSILAALYHLDYNFSLRDILGATAGTHEYSTAVQTILTTKVIGQAWSQMIDEFGNSSAVDAICSFGKSLFETNIRNLRPAGIHLSKDDGLELRVGFGCSVQIKDDQNIW